MPDDVVPITEPDYTCLICGKPLGKPIDMARLCDCTRRLLIARAQAERVWLLRDLKHQQDGIHLD